VSAVRSVVDQLVRRRLWPVAVVLLAGLVAVPVLMLKGASPASSALAPAPAPAPAATAQVDPKLTSAPTPAIVPAATGGNDRLLVGRAKNPFRAADASGAAERPAGTAAPTPGAGTSTPLPGTPVGSGAAGGTSTSRTGSTTPSDSGSTGTGPTSVPPAAPEPPATTTPTPLTTHVIGVGPYVSYMVDLRFGRAGAGRKIVNPARLSPLGSPTTPVALFYGVFNRGRSAGFLLSLSATAPPSACGGQVTGCSLIRVRPGHSVRLAVGPEGPDQRHYDIEVLRITAVRTTSYALALERQARMSPIGACLVSAGQSSGAIVFDARDGTFQDHGTPKECAKLTDGATARFSTVVDPGTAEATSSGERLAPATSVPRSAALPPGA
jgi:hypothetical protein